MVTNILSKNGNETIMVTTTFFWNFTKFYFENFEKSKSKSQIFENRISENFRKCTYSMVRGGSIGFITIYDNIYYTRNIKKVKSVTK